MTGLENISAHDGFGIAITGMSIVFVALLLITLYISVLPWLLKHLARVLPEEKPHYRRAEDDEVREEDLMIAAAIAATLHRRRHLQEKAR